MAAGAVWVVGFCLRFCWSVSWLLAFRATQKLKSKVLGRREVMQSDVHFSMGIRRAGGSSRAISGRARFCGHRSDSACSVDAESSLADRVYHCSYLASLRTSDPERAQQAHVAKYDHFCTCISPHPSSPSSPLYGQAAADICVTGLRVIVCLDTEKPYLLSIFYLVLDAVFVCVCSVTAWSLRGQRDVVIVQGPATLMAIAIVLWLGCYNLQFKVRDLAINNHTLPEIDMINDGKLWFAIQIPHSESYIYRQYPAHRNPWDLGWRRNLYQVLGGWDCLLPWRQSPNCVGYGRGGASDFEMNEEFRQWVEEKRREFVSEIPQARSRASDSSSLDSEVPLDLRHEDGLEDVPLERLPEGEHLRSSATAAGCLPALPPSPPPSPPPRSSEPPSPIGLSLPSSPLGD